MITPIDIPTITTLDFGVRTTKTGETVKKENDSFDKTIMTKVLDQWKEEIDFYLKEFVALHKLTIWSKAKGLNDEETGEQYFRALKQLKRNISSLEKLLHSDSGGMKINKKFKEIKKNLYQLDAEIKEQKLTMLNDLVGDYRISII